MVLVCSLLVGLSIFNSVGKSIMNIPICWFSLSANHSMSYLPRKAKNKISYLVMTDFPFVTSMVVFDFDKHSFSACSFQVNCSSVKGRRKKSWLLIVRGKRVFSF